MSIKLLPVVLQSLRNLIDGTLRPDTFQRLAKAFIPPTFSTITKLQFLESRSNSFDAEMHPLQIASSACSSTKNALGAFVSICSEVLMVLLSSARRLVASSDSK